MDVEDILALLDMPECERKPLASGFNPWKRPPQWAVGPVHATGYQKAIETKGIRVTCSVCGKERVVHPMMRGKALACDEHKYRAYRERVTAQGGRYWQTWAERAPQRERKKQREAG